MTNGCNGIRPTVQCPTSQGLVVAIIGVDGSGKTAVIDGLCKVLAKKYKISRIHLGVPPRSGLSFLIKGLLKIFRLLFHIPFIRKDAEATLYTNRPAFPGYNWIIYQLCLARDRSLAYQKILHQAKFFDIVICDRFPLPHIRLMDGPQVQRATVGYRTNWLIMWLIKWENKQYERIPLPDLAIVLKVDPEIAIKRKRKNSVFETVEHVLPCAEEILTADWGNLPVYTVDTHQPLEAVISEIQVILSAYLEKRIRSVGA